METVALIGASISLLEQLVPWIQKQMETAKQNAEMTPEQEQAFNDKLTTMFGQPWWQVSSFNRSVPPSV